MFNTAAVFLFISAKSHLKRPVLRVDLLHHRDRRLLEKQCILLKRQSEAAEAMVLRLLSNKT